MTTKKWAGLFLCLALLSACLYELTNRGLQFVALRQHSPNSRLKIAMVFPAQLSPHGSPSQDPSAYISRPRSNSQDSVSFVLGPLVSVDEPSLLHPPAEERKPEPEPFRSSNVSVGSADALISATGHSLSPHELELLVAFGGTKIAISNPLPHVRVEIPQEMKINDSGSIIAELKLLDSTLPSPEMRQTPKVVSSAFVISDPVQPNERSWLWNMRPIALGRQAITVEFTSAPKFDFKWENVGANFIVKGNTVTTYVDVRDELGLTPGYQAIFKSVGAFVALLGTIFGYPFVKARLESKSAVKSSS